MATPFATEGGHFYQPDGTPAYTIIGANGKERPTTLRDARKLGLYPSVTTIIGLAARPALERWKRNQVLLAALTLPRKSDESEAAWLERVENDWQEQGKRAAERGTAIHAAIERHYRGEPTPEHWEWVKAAKAELPEEPWRAERSFASPLGYGGKVDLHSDVLVVDVKTKEGDLGSPLYAEHLMQLAAYRAGLGIEQARAGILFVGREEPKARFVAAEESELAQGWEMFQALLRYFQAKTGHRP